MLLKRAREDTQFWLFIANLFARNPRGRLKQIMPLIVQRNFTDQNTTLVLWKVTEPTLSLLDLASQDGRSMSEVNSIVLEKRKREWLSTRILLNHLRLGAELKNLENGKPYLADGGHISISHCEDLAGVVISDHPIGLDIQRPEEKMRRISSRFCNETELTDAANSEDPLTYMSMIWSAKEAVFKYFGEHVHFAEDLQMKKFALEDRLLEIQYSGIHGQQIFRLIHESMDNFHIIHT